MAIFLNSAQGGMVTADTRLEGGREANDWDECVRIGNLLADEALRIIGPAPVEENSRIVLCIKSYSIPGGFRDNAVRISAFPCRCPGKGKQ